MPRSSLPETSAELLASAERLLAVLDAVPTPVRLLDMQGEPVWTNSAWRTWSGDAVEWAELVHPDDLPRARGALSEAVEQRTTRESLHRLKRGEDWIWVRERIAPFQADEDHSGFVVSAEQVDDERQEIAAVRGEADAAVDALEMVVGATGAVLATIDESARLLRLTDGFAAIHRATREQLIGRRIDELGKPLGPALAIALDHVLERGEGVQDLQVHDAEHDRWWSCSLEPLHRAGERAQGNSNGDHVALSAVEITARKRHEQALQLSEQRLRLAVAAAPLTLFHCDRKLRFTWVSRPMRGQTPEEMLGLTPSDLLGPAAEPLERLQRRVMRTGRGAHTEIALCDESSVSVPDPASETVIDFRPQQPVVAPQLEQAPSPAERTWECWAEPQRDDDGRVVGVMVVALESTDRKASEAALRQSEERFRGTFDNAGVGVAHMAIDGRILRINRRFCGILGYEAPELLGRSLHEVVHPDDWPAVERLQPPEDDARIRFFRRNGQVAWLLLTVSTSGDEQAGDAYAIVVAQDITAQARAERQLKELTSTLEQQVAKRTARLERQAEVLRRLAAELTTTEQRERKRLAEMLHDHLQQYLVAARLKVGLARRKAEVEVKQLLLDADAMLGEAVKSARTLTAELRPPVLYEDGLIPALRWLVGRVRDQHGLEVSLEAEPAAEPAEEHVRALLYAAIRELLLNIVKHADVKTAEVRVTRARDELHVAVQDHGKGFDAARLELDRTLMGFGIVSVRERVTALDGRMEVASSPGEGTTIHLFVPLAERVPTIHADDRLDEISVRPLARTGETVRVLLADDHKIVREGLGTLLEEQPGIEIVAHASDGQEAVELTAALQPDVVVMDVNMPRMNGIEATRVITQRWPHVAVVGLSVQDEAGTAESMREAGARAYLYKGGDPARLIETVLQSARNIVEV